jgi:hypothetical protein
MADELSPEHKQYFRTIFEKLNENGDNIMAKEVRIEKNRNLYC